MNAARYRRILVKLSGEALLGNVDYGIDPAMIKRVATELVEVASAGVEVVRCDRKNEVRSSTFS